MEYKCTRERFLDSVKNHEIKIIKDDELYRHISFKNPDSFSHYFDLITWPGYLTICGDMGTWTFSRIEDMFKFFIMDKNDFNFENIINPGYWSEKVVSISKFGNDGKLEVFDLELFKQQCFDYIKDYFYDNEEKAKECISNFEEEVLEYADEHYYQILYEKTWNYVFEDSDFETYREIFVDKIPEGKRYGFYFIWICYAIVWGINKYNEYKKEK